MNWEDDLVQRLRRAANNAGGPSRMETARLLAEAAAEIERLRGVVESQRKHIQTVKGKLASAKLEQIERRMR